MVVMFSTVVSFINKCSFRSYKFDKVDTFSSKLTTLARDSLIFRSLSSKLEFIYPLWAWGVEEQMLISSSCLTTRPGRVKGLWNSVFQLVIIANIWSPLRLDFSSPCLKSPHAHITERPRKNESEARVLIWRRTRFFRGRLITKILHLSERVTHLHIAVPTKTRFYASRIHVLKRHGPHGHRWHFL